MRFARQFVWVFCMVGAFHFAGRYHNFPSSGLVGFASSMIFFREKDDRAN